MTRPSRNGWVLLCLLLAACSAVTDFERGRLPATSTDPAGSDGGPSPTTGMDARVGMQPDSGVVVPSGDDGGNGGDGGDLPDTAPSGDCKSHADCASDRLCCGGQCVVTSEARCSDCEAACTNTSANACNGRVCGCGAGPACSGDRAFCAGNGGSASCVQCRDPVDCEGRTDGRTQCIQGSCAACDPANNAGCSGNTPICNPATFTCEACKTSPDNCPGTPVCTPSGACGGCSANDAADCTNPTSPICDLTANPATCRGCASGAECMTELSRPYCVNRQRCAVCNPNNDMGCEGTPTTPDCRLNGSGQYQCQACTASSCASGTRCDSATGRCVECVNNSHCDMNTARPFCGPDGTCRSCADSPGDVNVDDLWCLANTLAARPVCDTSGRCVRCNAARGCPAEDRCLVAAANPENNRCVDCTGSGGNECTAPAMCDTASRTCVQCTSNAHCTMATRPICNTANRMCRGCMADSECPTTAPACNTTTGACEACHPGQTGTASRCPSPTPVCIPGAQPSGPQCVACRGQPPTPVDADCTSELTPLCSTTNNCALCTTLPPATADERCDGKLRASGGGICTSTGACRRCEVGTNRGCSGDMLCCNQNGVPQCVARDANHCASCTDMCPATQTCMAGTCTPPVTTPGGAGTGGGMGMPAGGSTM